MPFTIRLGIPEVETFWNEMNKKYDHDQLTTVELKLFKKLVKTLRLLSDNPRHNSLNSHEIPPLTQKYGIKIWQSYLENNVPSAGRIFWTYGPNQGEITILGIEPHPEDKKRNAYKRIKLSSLPEN
ncbi:MAG: hypothetical protein U5R06_23425 [candidate division KSB1 bacterium]|nr:hypothetical protein [candidate division KSB1 bacterium]